MDAAQCNPYDYAPLGDARRYIRLLQIAQSKDSGALVLSLTIFEHAKAPPYLALSYTWGHLHPPAIVEIDRKGKMIVGRNCMLALERLRAYAPDSWFWIDCICVNQADVVEKGAQVGIMASIYAGAEEVIAYVGAHIEGSEYICRVLEEVAAKDGVNSAGFWYHWFRSFSGAETYRVVAALDDLSQRPYWSRLWVVQEIMLAKQVVIICGSSRLPWQTLISVYHGIFSTPTGVPVEHNGCNASALQTSFWDSHMHQLLVNSNGGRHLEGAVEENLPRLIWAFKHRVCADKRDRIFGLLGLVRDPASGPALKFDYSLSPLQVAVGAVAYIEANRASPWGRPWSLDEYVNVLQYYLGILPDDEDLTQMLRARRRRGSTGCEFACGALPPTADDTWPDVCRVIEIWAAKYCHRITADSAGRLFAGLRCSATFPTNTVDSITSRIESKYLEQSQIPTHQQPRRLYYKLRLANSHDSGSELDSVVAGLCCADTQPGDVLATLQCPGGPTYGLVLTERHVVARQDMQPRLCETIGQALLMPGCCIGLSLLAAGLDAHWQAFVLLWEPGDAFTFYADHDLEGAPADEKEKVAAGVEREFGVLPEEHAVCARSEGANLEDVSMIPETGRLLREGAERLRSGVTIAPFSSLALGDPDLGSIPG